MKCSIAPLGDGLLLKTPYDPGLVAELKTTIPATDRKYEPNKKAWIVASAYGSKLQNLCAKYFGESVTLPQIQTKNILKTQLLTVKYLGQCKIRYTGEITAFAWVDNAWSAIFTEQILRDWFEAGPAPVQAPDQADTLYKILGVAQTASLDEIKSGFRKMARLYHPDVCKEPNANELFIRVKEASDILSDSRKRSRYDAGLAFELSIKRDRKQADYQSFGTTSYRSPLRCGYVMVEGSEVIGRFVVSKILAWEEIQDDLGRTLVTSWPMGADQPVENWV